MLQGAKIPLNLGNLLGTSARAILMTLAEMEVLGMSEAVEPSGGAGTRFFDHLKTETSKTLSSQGRSLGLEACKTHHSAYR